MICLWALLGMDRVLVGCLYMWRCSSSTHSNRRVLYFLCVGKLAPGFFFYAGGGGVWISSPVSLLTSICICEQWHAHNAVFSLCVTSLPSRFCEKLLFNPRGTQGRVCVCFLYIFFNRTKSAMLVNVSLMPLHS